MASINLFYSLFNLTNEEYKNLSEFNTITTTNNKIFFIKNLSNYSDDDLYNISSENDLLTLIDDDLIGSIENFGLTFIYDNNKKERIIKQTNIDALEFNTVNEGTIEWCVIKINDDYFLFTDEVGTYDNKKSVNLDNLIANNDKKNILNNINFIIRLNKALEY